MKKRISDRCLAGKIHWRNVLYYWLPLLFWMGVIFYFSSQEGSGITIKNWQFYLERKGAHVTEYFVLTVLFLRIFFKRNPKLFKNKKNIFPYLNTLLICLIYAISDEFHQLFVFGREGKISDVGIDAVGVV